MEGLALVFGLRLPCPSGGCFSDPRLCSNKWALVLLTDEGLWEQVPLEWAIDGLRSIP